MLTKQLKNLTLRGTELWPDNARNPLVCSMATCLRERERVHLVQARQKLFVVFLYAGWLGLTNYN